ncbi:MAG: CHASE2 domain-containing protein [Bacillota bacterium]
MLKGTRATLYRIRPIWASLIAVLLVLIAAGPFRLFEGSELAAYDAWFSLRGERAPDPRVVIIGIDEPSLRQVGRWPWDRAVFADLLGHLGEAKVVAFDIIWTEPSEKPGDDERLAEAIRAHGRVVLSAYVRTDEVRGQVNQSLQRPLADLRQAARAGSNPDAAEGFVNTPSGEDSVVRAGIPVDTDTTGSPFPSLALAAVMQYEGLRLSHLEVEPFGSLRLGGRRIRRNELGQTYLNFSGGAGTIETISATEVLKGRVDPGRFRDRIVLVGPTSPTLKDEFPAPFAKDSTIGQQMPGVEIQATAVATYLNGNDIARVPHGITMLITLLFGLLVLAISFRFQTFRGATAALLLCLVYAGVVYLLWSHLRLWVDLVTPLVAGFLVYVTSTLGNYLRAEAEKRRVRNLFGRYVSQNVVEELLQNPEMLELGGKRFEVTVLFADIRGFTSFSETRDPHEVVTRLNQYFEAMVDVIYRHGGTLDKYMGDGIMAYFGAPLPMQDHAERALRTAWEMRQRIGELHVAWKSQGIEPFKIGVGLSSGEVIAGNVGHPDRVEYSLIGSSVNLAARLESLSREYPRSEYGGILCSASTYALAPEAVEELQPEYCGEVEVRGMSQKVQIYTV